MNCHYCKNRCIKKGKRKDGTQKYQCSSCKKYQQEEYKNKAWHPSTDKMIRKCVKRSGGIRDMSYIIEISATTVINRVKKIAKSIEKPLVLRNREYEADELKTYVKKKKNEQWIIYAIDKRTKNVVDYRVGKRNKGNVKTVIDTLLLAGAKRIYTDRLPMYRNLIPSELHKAVPHNTNHIERKNLNLRTHQKRLTRRTICFSKSVVMLSAMLKIYFWG